MVSSIILAEEKNSDYCWEKFFTDTVEKVYIIMKDGTIIRHSSQSERMIDISIGRLEEELKKVKDRNYSIKEIKIVIHNHQWKNYFSRSDYKQYWMLKSFKFDGQFLLYCYRTKKAYNIEKNK